MVVEKDGGGLISFWKHWICRVKARVHQVIREIGCSPWSECKCISRVDGAILARTRITCRPTGHQLPIGDTPVSARTCGKVRPCKALGNAHARCGACLPCLSTVGFEEGANGSLFPSFHSPIPSFPRLYMHFYTPTTRFLSRILC